MIVQGGTTSAADAGAIGDYAQGSISEEQKQLRNVLAVTPA